jgi:hypothetical protein
LIDRSATPQPPTRRREGGPIRRQLTQLFEDIGSEVERSWSAAGADLAVFPDVAAEVLHRRMPDRDVDVTDIVRWLLDTDELPTQRDVAAVFGEPPVSVYNGPCFEMQVLCWRAGTTAIHRHRFVGAFAVLEGVNLHTRYRSEPRHRISPTCKSATSASPTPSCSPPVTSCRSPPTSPTTSSTSTSRRPRW